VILKILTKEQRGRTSSFIFIFLKDKLDIKVLQVNTEKILFSSQNRIKLLLFYFHIFLKYKLDQITPTALILFSIIASDNQVFQK
jgi:hypothetical protein